MKKLAVSFATSALLVLAAPSMAHESRGGSRAYAYPSYGYGYQRPYYRTVSRPYGSGTYRPWYGRYRRPLVIVRQGPPYGWAWGHRRAYPARYVYYPRYGTYTGYQGSRTCDHDQGGWWGQRQGRDHDWND